MRPKVTTRLIRHDAVDTRSGKQNYHKRMVVSLAFHQEYSRYRDFLREQEVV